MSLAEFTSMSPEWQSNLTEKLTTHWRRWHPYHESQCKKVPPPQEEGHGSQSLTPMSWLRSWWQDQTHWALEWLAQVCSWTPIQESVALRDWQEVTPQEMLACAKKHLQLAESMHRCSQSQPASGHSLHCPTGAIWWGGAGGLQNRYQWLVE